MEPSLVLHRCFRLCITLLFFISFFESPLFAADSEKQEITFTITGFSIRGNTLFDEITLKNVINGFTGENMTSRDVESARNTLERFYQDHGYPTVLVNIPEQEVSEGMIILQIIEARIRSVEVVGNNYYSNQMIKSHLPSLLPGKIIYIPDVQKDLASINTLSKDLQVIPKIEPGRDAGAVDVLLMVKDGLPVHGGLTLSNRGTHDTTDLRLNAVISYDNLWQKGHSISFQYQTAPEKPSEVQVFGLSYVFSAPWEKKHILALYGISSDSETGFGEGFRSVGKGHIVGGRYILPLPDYKEYTHNLAVGFDYKDFDDTTRIDQDDFLKTPVTYMPANVAYRSSIFDDFGATRFNIGLKAAFRNMVTKGSDFQNKRSGSRGSYIYLTGEIARRQKLPWAMELFVQIDGQIADQPLISNEQFIAGGMENVRGYKESEESGDNAAHGTAALIWHEMDFGQNSPTIQPFVFFDGAWLQVLEPLPEQDENKKLLGTGFGFKGTYDGGFLFVSGLLEFEMAAGWALEKTDKTDAGDLEVHFNVSYKF
jgi:hemolysin activation/secretion protein